MDNKPENQQADTPQADTPQETLPSVNAPAMPELLTVSPSPHIKNPTNTRTIMIDVIIALTPALIWGIIMFGWRAALITAISITSCVLFEAIFQLIMHRKITVLDFSAVVTGMLIAMGLSSGVPLWIPVAGAFFAIVVVKQLFGGIGKNIVNPALAARVFMFAWPTEMGSFTEPGAANVSSAVIDATAYATPLASLKAGSMPDINIFDMFLGNMGGCIGEISALLLAAGGIYLLIRRVITWQTPVAYLGTVALLTFIFPQVYGNSASFMLSELFSGGLFIGAIFMATDYATTPVTRTGRLIFGVGCGIITVFIRYFGAYPEGVSFAILIMNLLVWYIDKLTMPRRFGYVKPPKKAAEKEVR